MFQASNSVQIASEFRRYKLKIPVISEARWSGTGKLMLDTGEYVV